MTKKQEIVLIGGGGHCKSVIDVIESAGNYTIVGILDVKEKIGQKVIGYDIIDSDDNIKEYLAVKNFCITVGQIKSANSRIKLYNLVKSLGGNLPVISASSAYISKYAVIEESTVIMHGAFVNAGVVIGKNNIINTKALLEHDVIIGNHNHISTGAIINADCKIGDESFVSSNVVINRGLTLNNKVIVGAGSVVTKNLSEAGNYWGNPCKFIV